MWRWLVNFLLRRYGPESVQWPKSNSSARPFQKHSLPSSFLNCQSSLWNIHFEFVLCMHYGHVWTITNIYFSLWTMEIHCHDWEAWSCKLRAIHQKSSMNLTSSELFDKWCLSHCYMPLCGLGSILERCGAAANLAKSETYLVTFPQVSRPFQCSH